MADIYVNEMAKFGESWNLGDIEVAYYKSVRKISKNKNVEPNRPL